MNVTQVKPQEEVQNVQYDRIEQEFIEILELENLDQKVALEPQIVADFETAVSTAIHAAYQQNDDAAHLFLQRVLYRINRLKFFWYDDLRRYTNERSLYLQKIVQEIEAAWEEWEFADLDVAALQAENVRQGLIDRVAVDKNAPMSEDGRYIAEQVTKVGYRQLVAIGSLDGLVEASQFSRTLAGASNEIHAILTRVLIDEYGAGRLPRKHSSHYTTMLTELGLKTETEAYFDLVPWESLAATNYGFIMSECKRHFLRYIGGLLYFEVVVPGGFSSYQAAGERLGLSPKAMAYWDLHIRVDEIHARWMLNDVALPLIERYPAYAWELLLGYDQQRLIGPRAGAAIARSIRNAELAAAPNN